MVAIPCYAHSASCGKLMTCLAEIHSSAFCCASENTALRSHILHICGVIQRRDTDLRTLTRQTVEMC